MGSTYNHRMRTALLITLALSCASICQAQSANPARAASEPQKISAPNASGAIEKRIERIHIEDASTSIEELRVGGETKTIEVKPKGGMPAYQVEPTKGERSWKILGF